ncbi:MAG: hypothetical protein Q7R81_03340, partial [Candidatus Peregrinibacteria bacterium]|nr:hypothetical protein [Candidatus Peregrinibacteria bacterium]
MSRRIKIISTKYWRLAIPLLYGVSVVLWSIGFPWFIRTVFILYGAFIYWTLSSARCSWSPKPLRPPSTSTKRNNHWITFAIIFVSFLLLSLTRLIPFVRFGEAPLGYDTGFYVGSIKSLVSPGTPASSALYRALTPLFAAGLSPSFLYHFFHVLTQVLLAGGLFFLLSSLATPLRYRLATVAVLLYTLSVVQFLGYWWAFTQQMLGMGFFLVTLGLFVRRSYGALFFALITFLVHTPTGAVLFLALALSYLAYGTQLLTQRRFVYPFATKILVAGVLLLPLALLVKQIDVRNIFTDILGAHGILLRNVPQERISEFRGLFVVPGAFRLLVLGYVPFSLFTVLHPATWIRRSITKLFFFQNLALLYAALIVLLLVTFSPVIYQSRFSVILDFLLLVFATPTMLLFAEHFSRDRTGKLLVGLLLTFFLLSMGLNIHQQRPMVFSEELEEIKTYTSFVEPTAGVLATDSLYAPWLWGFFRWSTLSPGYLGDSWDYATWTKFWSSASDKERLQLLGSRDHPPPPMYIHIGERQQQGLPFQRFVRTS